MLDVKGLNVFYGGVQALRNVTFSVQKGEVVSIVGSNGAGKSTSQKAISGVLRQKQGTIEFLGKDIISLPSHEIVKMGLIQIPEGRKIFPTMSVLENLELGSYTARAKKRREESLKKICELFPILEERKHQVAGTLSGGEQQMLAIGRGLMSIPELLMLDEPSLGLAPLLVKEMLKIVKTINSAGITILLVEQNVAHALEISSRSYVLENGAIVLEGKGGDLLRNEHVRKAYMGM
jgi:branched-chain amino acid transport system ATP-binding protein